MQLELNDIHKSFGDKHVLRGMSFTVNTGRAFGLLGRNGSGKTTTARIILDVFRPDQGEVLLDGKRLESDQSRFGYLPEEKGLYPKLPIVDQLIYFGQLRGMTKRAATEAANHWLEVVELSHEKTRKLETLSKGNQQKVQLICALLTDPDILILDEPFSGLDPVNARLLKTIVTEEVAKGKLVLFSSHQMAEVETFCDDIAILHDGTIALSGRLSQIKRSYPQDKVELRILQDGRLVPQPEMLRIVSDLAPERALAEAVGDDLVSLKFQEESERRPFLTTLLNAGYDVDLYEVTVPSLAEIFVETTTKGASHG